MTGIRTFFGRRLIETLRDTTPETELVAIDTRAPNWLPEDVEFERVDLMSPSAVDELEKIFSSSSVDAVVHAAFRRLPSPNTEFDHELECEGTRRVLEAIALSGVRRLVVPSSTMVYGANAGNPSHLAEGASLQGHPCAHQVENRIEVEGLLAEWQELHPEVDVTVLRFCWIFGPTYWDAVVRFFSSASVPTILGFDPLFQFVHEDDAMHALMTALLESHPGVFNVVGKGVLPLSTLLRLAGKRRLSLPTSLLERLHFFPTLEQTGDEPRGFYDYLRFPWIADGAHGWSEFGEPVYTTREAWISFVGSQRMRGYAALG